MITKFKLFENKETHKDWLLSIIEEWRETWNSYDEDIKNDDGEDEWGLVNDVLENFKNGTETVEDCEKVVYYIESFIGQEGDIYYDIVSEYIPYNFKDVEDFHFQLENLYKKIMKRKSAMDFNL